MDKKHQNTKRKLILFQMHSHELLKLSKTEVTVDRTCSPTTLLLALLKFFLQCITFNPMGAPMWIVPIYYISGTSVNKSVPSVFLGKT